MLSPTNQPTNQPTTAASNINWAGPYVGGYIGGAWGNSNFNTNVGALTDTSYFISTANINSVNQSGSRSLSPHAIIGGIQAGNNWILYSKLANFVYGLALDFGSFHLGKVNNATSIPYPTAPLLNYSLQTSMKTNWLFTARGRAGITPNASWPFIYATGGLAVTRLQVANNFNDTDTGFGGTTNNNTKAGWTVGGGIELPLTNNLVMTSEYLYVNFGSVSATNSITCSNGGCPEVSPLLTSANLTANLLKVGLNYKFS